MGGWPAVLHCGGRRCSADSPAVLGARGRAQNSPSHGRHPAAQAACARCSDRLRSTPRLAAMRNPRAPALLGAAEAHARPPAHGFAKNQRCTHPRVHCGSRRGAGGRQAQRLCGAEQRRPVVGARSARASSSDSSRLFERSERSERSEFRDATAGRAAQGSRRYAATAAVKRSLPPARTSARSQTALCCRRRYEHERRDEATNELSDDRPTQTIERSVPSRSRTRSASQERTDSPRTRASPTTRGKPAGSPAAPAARPARPPRRCALPRARTRASRPASPSRRSARRAAPTSLRH